jgi:hypothetical protein
LCSVMSFYKFLVLKTQITIFILNVVIQSY